MDIIKRLEDEIIEIKEILDRDCKDILANLKETIRVADRKIIDNIKEINHTVDNYKLDSKNIRSYQKKKFIKELEDKYRIENE